MARYFFNLHDGTDYPDKDGQELPSIEEARRHAAQYAGEMLKDPSNNFWNGHKWTIDVADEHGVVLFGLEFTAKGPSLD